MDQTCTVAPRPDLLVSVSANSAPLAAIASVLLLHNATTLTCFGLVSDKAAHLLVQRTSKHTFVLTVHLSCT